MYYFKYCNLSGFFLFGFAKLNSIKLFNKFSLKKKQLARNRYCCCRNNFCKPTAHRKLRFDHETRLGHLFYSLCKNKFLYPHVDFVLGRVLYFRLVAQFRNEEFHSFLNRNRSSVPHNLNNFPGSVFIFTLFMYTEHIHIYFIVTCHYTFVRAEISAARHNLISYIGTSKI